jgi:2-oxoglutarate ferredoxin oxidoreductase subunit alpha
LVPEINNGQLLRLLRDKYLVPAVGFNVIKGLPLRAEDIQEKIEAYFGTNDAGGTNG